MDGKYCDCNCGMTDPDCLSATLEVKYCNLKDNEICSPLGRCTQAVYSSVSNEVAVSQACHEVIMPGETGLYGYVGHPNEEGAPMSFHALGGAECETCPHDAVYRGLTNKDANNEYVCQYRPDGDIPAKAVIAYEANVTTWYGDTYTAGGG